jgi:hypothetical protein
MVRGVVPTAVDYVTDITSCQPTQVTALEPRDEGGWIVELEVVADHRIPSSADMLELYEIELDADGEVVGHHRIGRYMRYQQLSSTEHGQMTVNGDANAVGQG